MSFKKILFLLVHLLIYGGAILVIFIDTFARSENSDCMFNKTGPCTQVDSFVYNASIYLVVPFVLLLIFDIVYFIFRLTDRSEKRKQTLRK
jgi:hypothetical protein